MQQKMKHQLPYIDSHAHLAHMKNLTSANDLVQKIESLHTCIDVGLHPSDVESRLATAKHFTNVHISAGIYPSYCNEDIPLILEQLNSIVKNTDVIAIGECGIDLYHDYGSLELQTTLFQGQIEIAIDRDLPLIIHARESLNEVYESIKKYINSGHKVRGVMHCFSGGPKEIRQFLDLGLYISFAGNLTYKSALNLQEACRECDLDKLLFETDSPYLSPVPKRGKKNNPGNVIHTYEYAAQLLEIDIQDLTKQVSSNFEALFNT